MCIIHKWENWKNCPPPNSTWQERSCEKCGKRKVRIVYSW